MATREVVDAMYHALSTGNWRGFTALLADDVVISEPRYLSYGGTYRGASGLRTIGTQIATTLDMSTLSVERMVVEGERAFVVCSVAVRPTGERLVAAEEITVREGKVTSWTVYVHDAADLLPSRARGGPDPCVDSLRAVD